MKKIGNIVRYSIGILFIIGMFGMASDSVLAGILWDYLELVYFQLYMIILYIVI